MAQLGSWLQGIISTNLRVTTAEEENLARNDTSRGCGREIAARAKLRRSTHRKLSLSGDEILKSRTTTAEKYLMSGDQEKSTSTGAEQAPNPPALPQYPPQPFPGGPYPPPPGAYTWYYPPPRIPMVIRTHHLPGHMLCSHLQESCMGIHRLLLLPKASHIYSLELWAISGSPACRRTRAKRKQVKMACTNCASACKRCDEARPCQRCQKYGLTDSCVDGVRKARKVGVKRGPYKRFPPNGEGSWVAPSDQADSALPGATPLLRHNTCHLKDTGHIHIIHPSWLPHPAYYPIHPGYPPVPIYPPPPGAYGPIPTLPGQTPATEQTASNQAATSDDERAVVERPKKKKRVGGEEGVAKSGKKSKRGTNTTGDAPTAVVTVPAPASDDSPDDHGSPVAHNGSGNVGGEPLPPVIAAA
ncbi:hypothetical protein BJV77DRAFT_959660 [Russula vinacea]|nr:hypothetical protein BJV77DRAFT_959660 [Russula vinacea]